MLYQYSIHKPLHSQLTMHTIGKIELAVRVYFRIHHKKIFQESTETNERILFPSVLHIFSGGKPLMMLENWDTMIWLLQKDSALLEMIRADINAILNEILYGTELKRRHYRDLQYCKKEPDTE